MTDETDLGPGGGANRYIDLIRKIERLDERSQENTRRFDVMEKKLHETLETMTEEYVKKAEFDPIKKIVYGFVSFLLLAIGGMFMTLLTKTGGIIPPGTH